MIATQSCPSAVRWHEISEGRLDNAEAEALLEHLQSCPSCAHRLRTLPRDETLEASLRQETQVDEPLPAPVQMLISRLKSMPVVRSSNDVTAALNSNAEPQASAPPMDEITQEVFGFLEAAQGSDELGRLGGYRVLKLLGSGGMGAVFLAEDVSLQRRVALKLMRPAVAANASARDRFLREARACAALKHDNIVTIYQVGQERGVPFLAMEFLQGMPLDALLESNRKLTVAQILRIGREIARGLAAAHEKGLIHRDIKPANIWLDKESGRVKILDFGLARSEAENTNLTQSGTIIGTPAFMAPEQARGEKVDGRTDLFSLGALLYRVCAGTNPFTGSNTLAVLTSLALDTPKPVAMLNPSIPAALSALIERLMAKDPAGRPESAKAVVAEIQAIERGLAAPTPAPVAEVKPRPQPKRGGRWIAIAASLLCAIGVVAAVIVYQVKTPDGTLVVELDDPDIQIVLKQNGVVVQDPTTKREFLLKVGDGELVVTDRDGVVLPTKAFTIKKGEQTRLRVTLEGRAAEKPPAVPATVGGESLFDRLARDRTPAEEWAFAGNGDVTRVPKELVGIFGSSRWHSETYPVDLVFRPGTKQLASLDNPNAYASLFAVRFWDSETGRLLDANTAKLTDCVGFVYSPDGKTFALAQKISKEVRLFEADTLQLIRTLAGHSRPVVSMRFSPDGKRLYSACGPRFASTPSSGEVIAWNVGTGEPLWKVAVEKDAVADMVLSPDGKTLFASAKAWGDEIRLLDAETGKEVRKITGHKDPAMRLVMHPDGTRLAVVRSAEQFGKLQVLDVATGKELYSRRCWFHPHVALALAYSPDGKWLAFETERFQPYVLNAATHQIAHALESDAGSFAALAFSPDSRTLAVGHIGGRIATWDVTTGKRIGPDPGQFGRILNLSVSGNGQRIATAGYDGIDGCVRIWDVAAGRVERTVPTGTPFPTALFPDGSAVVTASHYGYYVWDAATGQSRTLPNGVKGRAGGGYAAVSPDGNRILLSDMGTSQLVFVDSRTGMQQLTVRGVGAYLAWSPDGKYVATDKHGPIDATTGKPLFPPEQKFAANGLGFTPDSRTLLLAYNDRVERWDLATAQKTETVPCPAILIKPVFSPDGRWLAGLNANRPVVIDAATGKVARELLTPTGAKPSSVAFAPDSRHLLVGNVFGTVYIYRIADAPALVPPVPVQPAGRSITDELRQSRIAAEERAFAGNGDPAHAPKELVGVLGSSRWYCETYPCALAYRPGTRQLAALENANVYATAFAVRLWDAETGRPLDLNTEKLNNCVGLAYSPDGKTVALAWKTREIRLFEADTLKPIRVLAGNPRPAVAMCFSPDGKRLYSACGPRFADAPKDGEIVAWNLATGEPLWKVAIEKDAVADMVLSPDGKTLFASAKAWGDEIRLLDAETGKEVRKITGHKDPAMRLVMHPDGTRLAVVRSAEQFGKLQVLDVATGKELYSRRCWFHPHVAPALAYSPDGKWLAFETERFQPYLLNAATHQIAHALESDAGSFAALAFSPDSGKLAVGHVGGRVATWDVTTGKRLGPDPGHFGRTSEAHASGNGQRVVTGGTDNFARIWDVATGRVEWSISTLKGTVTAVSPDASVFITASNDGYFVWDAATGKSRTLPNGLRGSSDGGWAAYSPDGNRILLNDIGKKQLVIVDAQFGGQLLSVPGYGYLLAWSPDGKYVASDKHGAIDAETGKVLFPPEQKINALGVSFTPDSRTLLLSFADRIERWDLATATKTATVPCPATFAKHAFSPDGRWLAGLNANRPVVIDAATGKVARELLTPTGAKPSSVAFAPDSRHLLVGNVFGTVYIYRLDDSP